MFFTCLYVTKSVTQILCSQMIMAVTLLSDVGHQNPQHGEIQLLTLLPAGQLSALPRKCWGQTNPMETSYLLPLDLSLQIELYEKRPKNRWGGLDKLWGPYKWTVFWAHLVKQRVFTAKIGVKRPPLLPATGRTCCSFQGSENATKTWWIAKAGKSSANSLRGASSSWIRKIKVRS